MARKRITQELLLNVLIEAKKEMDANTFNSYLFRAQHPTWGVLNPILVEKGVIQKVHSNYKWITIDANIHMAREVLVLYRKRIETNYAKRMGKESSELNNTISFEELVKEAKTVMSVEPEVKINPSEECYRLAKIISENEELINIQKDTIANQNEKLSNQFSYISDLEEIMEDYKKDIDTLEKEFTELKKSINNQNNLYIKPNSKKIKVLGIPLYSVEY